MSRAASDRSASAVTVMTSVRIMSAALTRSSACRASIAPIAGTSEGKAFRTSPSVMMPTSRLRLTTGSRWIRFSCMNSLITGRRVGGGTVMTGLVIRSRTCSDCMRNSLLMSLFLKAWGNGGDRACLLFLVSCAKERGDDGNGQDRGDNAERDGNRHLIDIGEHHLGPDENEHGRQTDLQIPEA